MFNTEYYAGVTLTFLTAKMAAAFKITKDLSRGTLQSSVTSLLNPSPDGFHFTPILSVCQNSRQYLDSKFYSLYLFVQVVHTFTT